MKLESKPFYYLLPQTTIFSLPTIYLLTPVRILLTTTVTLPLASLVRKRPNPLRVPRQMRAKLREYLPKLQNQAIKERINIFLMLHQSLQKTCIHIGGRNSFLSLRRIKPTQLSQLCVPQKLTTQTGNGRMPIHNTSQYRIPYRTNRIVITTIATFLFQYPHQCLIRQILDQKP